MREHHVHLTTDTSSILSAIASLEHFSQFSLEVGQRLLDLGDALVQTRSIDMGYGSTGTREIRILFEPSDGLAQLLSACLAGELEGL